MLTNNKKVIFFKINDAKTKLIKIIQTAMMHFEKKENLLIKTFDSTSLNFVDELLWKLPKESFLPHVKSNSFIEEFIVITTENKNLNNAKYLFNLCPEIVDINLNFKTIYDLEDNTSQIKQANSKKRYLIYKQNKFLIELK
ncbi:MAG: hypothetical protein A3F40_03115 [Chlamydiae bacterium RIFCSPHIGHO2_12_FULL_27_8]|nr:MAG: hypothetical protein A3F40_03115 [Chlamydiae bacterium RIFCSPHIGHO2_12_FULL_27_8]